MPGSDDRPGGYIEAILEFAAACKAWLHSAEYDLDEEDFDSWAGIVRLLATPAVKAIPPYRPTAADIEHGDELRHVHALAREALARNYWEQQ